MSLPENPSGPHLVAEDEVCALTAVTPNAAAPSNTLARIAKDLFMIEASCDSPRGCIMNDAPSIWEGTAASFAVTMSVGARTKPAGASRHQGLRMICRPAATK